MFRAKTSTAQYVPYEELFLERSLDSARNLEFTGRYHDALFLYNALLKIDQYKKIALLRKGLLLEKMGNLEDALFNLNICTTYYPDFSEAWFSSGLIRMKIRQYEAAIEDFEMAEERLDNETNLIIWSGYSYGESLTPGLVTVATAETWKPNIHFQKALCYKYLGNHTDALLILNRLCSDYPDRVQYLFERGIIHHKQGNLALALSDMQAVLALDPENSAAMFNLQEWDSSPKSLDQNLAVLNRLIENKPEEVEHWSKRGLIYFKEQRYHEALADFNQAAFIEPKNANVFYNRALVLEKLENYEAAASDFEKALSIDDKNVLVLSGFAILHLRQKKYTLAIDCLTKAIEIEPDYAAYYYNRAIAYQGLKNVDQACRDFSKAGELGMQIGVDAASKICKTD
jgi:tetratricopeptide (TPR) repeat protein